MRVLVPPAPPSLPPSLALHAASAHPTITVTPPTIAFPATLDDGGRLGRKTFRVRPVEPASFF